MKKRIISILMVVLLIFGTCACNNQGEKAKADDFSMVNIPSYEEKEIGSKIGLSIPGNKLGLDSKNQLLLTDFRGKEAFCVIADETGKKLQDFENNAPGPIFTLDAQDNRYVVGEEYVHVNEGDKTREVKYILDIYNSKGEKQKFLDIGKFTFNGEQAGITDIAVDSKGTVYLLIRGKSIEVIDKDGKKDKNIPAKNFDYIEIDDEDNLIIGSVSGDKGYSTIEKRSAEKLESIWTKELDSGHSIKEMRYSHKNKKLYILTDKGILSCSSDGTIEGYIFELKQSSLLDSGIYIYDIALDSNKNIYVLAFKSESSSESTKYTPLLYKYTPTKDKQKSNDQNTLNISLRYSERYIEAAISNFKKAHPEIKVEVKDYSAAMTNTSEDEINRALKAEEDFQRIISTELMAGNGPDIMEIGGLPYKKFIDKNVLANLSEIIKNDTSFDINKYSQNILNACKYKDNLYIMPMNFSFNAFGGSKNIMDKEGLNIDSTKWTWRDFLSIAQKVTKDLNGDGKPDQYALPKMTAEEIFSYIFDGEYSTLIDFDKKTANFDSPEFIDMLKFAKDFSSKDVFSPTLTSSSLWEMTDPGTIGFNRYYFSTYQSVIQAQGLNNGEVEFLDMPSYSGKRTSNDCILGRTYAINNNSQMKSEAWEFIKFLLSDEIQTNPNMFYFPVNINSLKSMSANEISQNYVYENYKERGRNIKPLTQKDVDMVNEMIGGLNTIPYSEKTISKIITEGVKDFFDGKKTAEEVAKLIQNKVNIYFGE